MLGRLDNVKSELQDTGESLHSNVAGDAEASPSRATDRMYQHSLARRRRFATQRALLGGIRNWNEAHASNAKR